MNRYETILLQLVAARVADGMGVVDAAESPYTRTAADILEAHFQARDAVELERTWGGDVPALLKRQAE